MPPSACLVARQRTRRDGQILANQLLFRADSFKPRDAFDMAAALELDRPAAFAALRATASKRQALLVRLEHLAAIAEADLLMGILPTVTGRRFATGMVARLVAATHEAGAG